MIIVEIKFHIKGGEEIVVIHSSVFAIFRAAIRGIIDPLSAVFVSDTEIDRYEISGIESSVNKTGSEFRSGKISILRLHFSFNDDISVFDIILIQVVACGIWVFDIGVDTINIIVKAYT